MPIAVVLLAAGLAPDRGDLRRRSRRRGARRLRDRRGAARLGGCAGRADPPLAVRTRPDDPGVRADRPALRPAQQPGLRSGGGDSGRLMGELQRSHRADHHAVQGLLFPVAYAWTCGVVRLLVARTVADLAVGVAMVGVATGTAWLLRSGSELVPGRGARLCGRPARRAPRRVAERPGTRGGPILASKPKREPARHRGGRGWRSASWRPRSSGGAPHGWWRWSRWSAPG